MVSLAGETQLSAWAAALEVAIQKQAHCLYPETEKSSLHAACRYALEGRGKYIRPLLTLASAAACGAAIEGEALSAALPLEWIHTYSLVHDDLPCMDDDDLRRGRPTTHKVFGEATALLVGDALLTDAFLLLSELETTPSVKLSMLKTLAAAAGGRGMVAGQALDMKWTGQSGYGQEDLDAIHRHKTGRLIEAACLLGGYWAEASPAALEALSVYAARIGLVFQIVDDLLDDQAAIGKTPGKDQALGKLTYLSLMSREAARARAAQLTREALEALTLFGDSAACLRSLASRLLERSF